MSTDFELIRQDVLYPYELPVTYRVSWESLKESAKLFGKVQEARVDMDSLPALVAVSNGLEGVNELLCITEDFNDLDDYRHRLVQLENAETGCYVINNYTTYAIKHNSQELMAGEVPLVPTMPGLTSELPVDVWLTWKKVKELERLVEGVFEDELPARRSIIVGISTLDRGDGSDNLLCALGPVKDLLLNRKRVLALKKATSGCYRLSSKSIAFKFPR